MDRSSFLEAIRIRLPDGERRNGSVPDGWAVDIADPLNRFEEELTAVGGTPWRSDHLGLTGTLKEILTSSGVSTALVTAEPLVPRAALEVVADEEGIALLDWPDCGIDGASAADMSIGGAVAGVAETGSILISSSAPGGRSPSLLPAVHVAILALTDLLPTVAALFSSLTRLRAGASSVTLCTGPSKSSDIGKELIVGVHGPGVTHVVVVTDR